MSNEPINPKKILSIYPTRIGFSYSYFESPTEIIEWGNCIIRTKGFEKKLQIIIEKFAPEIVITEEHDYLNFKRSKGIVSALKCISKIADKNDIYLKKYTRAMIQGVFSCFEINNKYETAKFIASVYPELKCKLPPEPKIWKGQHYRMSLFDSIAFAFSYYYVEGNLNSN